MLTTTNLNLKKPEGTDIVNIEDLNGNMDILDNTVANKVDKVVGKQLSIEDYTTAEKTKLAGIAEGATNYTHPVNHPASIVTQDAGNRFVTDVEKASWNAKETPAGAQAKADIVQANLSAHTSSAAPHSGHVSHALATAANDFLVASEAGAFVKKTPAEVKAIFGLGSAAYTDSAVYATAEQGAKADAATPQIDFASHSADSAIRPDKSIPDITLRLQAMFDNNPNGGTFYIPYSGSYQLTKSLTPPNNSHIIFNNKLELICPNGDCCFRLTSRSNVTINGGRIKGNVSTGNASQNGIRIEMCNNIEVDGVIFENTFQNGVFISHSTNVRIRNSIATNASCAFFAYESTKVQFENSQAIEARFEYAVQYKSCTDSEMINVYVDTPMDVGIMVNKAVEDGSTTPRNISS